MLDNCWSSLRWACSGRLPQRPRKPGQSLHRSRSHYYPLAELGPAIAHLCIFLLCLICVCVAMGLGIAFIWILYLIDVAYGTYSSYYCNGRPWYYHRHSARVNPAHCRNNCVFRNVGFNSATKKFVFYRHPNRTESPLLFDGLAREYRSLPSDFAYRDLYFTTVESIHWETSFGTYPGNISSKVNVLTTRDTLAFNFGHHTFDFLMPFYYFVELFNVDYANCVITTWNIITETQYFRMLSPYPAISLIAGGDIGFSRLVLGDYTCMAWHDQPLFKNLSVYLQSASGRKPAKVTNPHIVILKKNGRRTPINHAEAVSYLSKRFPSIRITVLEDISRTTLPFQLELFSSTSLLISPAGGISATALMLPYGATVLQYGFYNNLINSSYDYDSMSFSFYPHISSAIYPVLKEELQEPCPKALRQGPMWGDYVFCDFRIELNRLGLLVDAIIDNWILFNKI